jgi:hypothetical protein
LGDFSDLEAFEGIEFFEAHSPNKSYFPAFYPIHIKCGRTRFWGHVLSRPPKKAKCMNITASMKKIDL